MVARASASHRAPSRTSKQEDQARNELNSALQGVKTLEILKEKNEAKKAFESKNLEYRDNDELIIQKKASETQRAFPLK